MLEAVQQNLRYQFVLVIVKRFHIKKYSAALFLGEMNDLYKSLRVTLIALETNFLELLIISTIKTTLCPITVHLSKNLT